MVNVEQRALCAFSQHVFALEQYLVQLHLGVRQVKLAHVVHAFEPHLLLLRNVVVSVVQVAQNLLVARFQGLIFGVEVVQDVAYPQSHAGSLVAVGGANAFARGAHLVLAFGGLIGAVQHTVCGQNEVCPLADVQAFGEFVASGLQFVRLGHEEVGSNHAAVTYDVDFLLVEDARGNAAQHKLLAVEDDGVSRIRAAGKACHHVVAGRKVVHHFTLALVAEYDAQQSIHFSFCHYVCCFF